MGVHADKRGCIPCRKREDTLQQAMMKIRELEREREEARREAERLRALLRRQATISGAMAGLPRGAETPGCEPFPWERGGDDG